jgi:DNA-binding transcriptional ArsR family regulator
LSPVSREPLAPPSTLGSNRDVIRQHNLSAVLRLLRKYGTMSRSALAQRTELNRSTISDLVTELEELGLITESDTSDRTGVGRPSRMVALSEDVTVFAVNPETDAITVGLVTLSGTVLRKERVTLTSAPEPSEAIKIAGRVMADIRRDLPRTVRIAGIGVAVPGQVRVDDGVVRLAPHLNWVEVPFTNAPGSGKSMLWLP